MNLEPKLPSKPVKNSNTLVILQNKLDAAPIPPKHSSKPTVSKSNTSVTLPNCQQQHLCQSVISPNQLLTPTIVILPKQTQSLPQYLWTSESTGGNSSDPVSLSKPTED